MSMKTDVDQHFFAKMGYCKNIESIYKHERDYGVVDTDGKTALHIAVEENNKKYVEKLLSVGINENYKDSSRKTPLHYAVQEPDATIADVLLSKGADPNQNDKNGVTPFYLLMDTLLANFEIRTVDIELVKSFLKHNADPDSQDSRRGWTPLIYALLINNKTIINLLEKAGSASFICKRDDLQRLHSMEGPAIKTENGVQVYAIEGAIVSRKVVECPHELDVHFILFEERQKAQRIQIEQYGKEKFMNDVAMRIVDKSEETVLYQTTKDHMPEPISFLKVTDATSRADGTREEYYLRVPPSIETADEALAWTFRKNPEGYNPKIET